MSKMKKDAETIPCPLPSAIEKGDSYYPDGRKCRECVSKCKAYKRAMKA